MRVLRQSRLHHLPLGRADDAGQVLHRVIGLARLRLIDRLPRLRLPRLILIHWLSRLGLIPRLPGLIHRNLARLVLRQPGLSRLSINRLALLVGLLASLR